VPTRQPGQVGSARHRARDMEVRTAVVEQPVGVSTARKTLLETSPGKPVYSESEKLQILRSQILAIPPEFRPAEMTNLLRRIDMYNAKEKALKKQPTFSRDESEVKKLATEKEKLEVVASQKIRHYPDGTREVITTPEKKTRIPKDLPEGYEVRTVSGGDVFLDMKPKITTGYEEQIADMKPYHAGYFTPEAKKIF
jgi:hypothetical protein